MEHDPQVFYQTETEIFLHIKKAYWQYDQLKGEELRCNTWIAQMMEA